MLIGLVCGLSGCSQGIRYKAAELPAQYAAVPVESTKMLDLSKLAGPSVGAERIGLGDVLEVSIAGGLGSDATTVLTLRVTDDGHVIIPEVGQVHLDGMELADAEMTVHQACISSQQYMRPSVAITMKSQRRNTITVIGAVNEPGVKELRRGSSYLLDAFVAAGGPADDADIYVEIQQPTPPGMIAFEDDGTGAVRPVSANMGVPPRQVTELNLVDAVASPNGGKYLADGSVVMIKRREPRPLHIMGLVTAPDVYEYPVNRDLTVLEAIAMAKGCSVPVADKVYVVRSRPDVDEPIVIEVSLSRAKHSRAENVRLEPGDLISVEETPATIAMHALNIIRFSLGSSVPLF